MTSKIWQKVNLASALLIMQVVLMAPAVAFAMAPYDPKPWLEDLAQVRDALLTKYANLEWVVLEREVNLKLLFDDAKAHIESAGTEAEARAVFDTLARSLGDG